MDKNPTEVNGNNNCLAANMFENIFFYVPHEKRQVWNDMRVS